MAEQAKNNGMNHYVLLKEDGTDGDNIFTGHQPRQAAIKAARKFGGTKEKPKIITLRERGVHEKAHQFKAWVATVPAPAKRPAWLKKDTITQGQVGKVGMIDLKVAEAKAEPATPMAGKK